MIHLNMTKTAQHFHLKLLNARAPYQKKSPPFSVHFINDYNYNHTNSIVLSFVVWKSLKSLESLNSTPLSQ